ncbi:MAG: carboxypeptidase-like regulatory domain-containing protein [Marinifilaceae bacterium]|jgi:hypothetical protein|nr:carboxypeptidase-like regulatory domain-containing protein [Marinifilaceae bacterium]
MFRFLLRIILINLLIFSHSKSGFSQEKKNILYSIKIPDASIEDLFENITKKYGIHFTYKSELFNQIKSKDYNYQAQTMQSILRHSLGQEFKFNINKNQIVINKIEQNSPKLFLVKAVVTDAQSKSSLPGANISLKNTTIGTITNSEGEFALNIDEIYKSDSLQISFLGYKNKTIAIADITKISTNIALRPLSVSLQEILIRNNNPRSLIEICIKKLNDKIYPKAHNLDVYYREWTKKGINYSSYFESLANIYIPKHINNSLTEPRIRIKKARKIKNRFAKDTVQLKLRGGMHASISIDPTKNNSPFLNSNYLNFYDFRLRDLNYINDRLIYIIDFTHNKIIKDDILPNGTLYIDMEDLFLLRAEYWFDKIELKKIKDQLISKKTNRLKVNPKKAYYSIDYIKHNDYYFPKHIESELEFKIRKKRSLFSKNFISKFEMLISNIELTNIKKHKFSRSLKSKTILIDTDYNYTFWNGNNIIYPEKQILKAIENLNRNH